ATEDAGAEVKTKIPDESAAEDETELPPLPVDVADEATEDAGAEVKTEIPEESAAEDDTELPPLPVDLADEPTEDAGAELKTEIPEESAADDDFEILAELPEEPQSSGPMSSISAITDISPDPSEEAKDEEVQDGVTLEEKESLPLSKEEHQEDAISESKDSHKSDGEQASKPPSSWRQKLYDLSFKTIRFPRNDADQDK
ncbi:MAG: hypothetical protein GX117_07470, partial [Candidatus Hydrogenedentes bacterium]|nr:hypothetical protein [Candidatus Hydrogenedentota bacterium]